jgi:hypothetical protein
MGGEVSALGARGGYVAQREISERYLGSLYRWGWLSRLFWLYSRSRRSRLTRWIGEMLLCLQGWRFNALRFLRTFRVREDRRLGGCRRSGRDHRDLLVNDPQTRRCRARTDDGGEMD